MAMLRILLGLIVVLVLSLPGAGSSANRCGKGSISHATPALPYERPCTDCFELAEGSSKTCTESCMSQCRSAEQSCSGSGCKAQFQICARRCVVSCGSR
jgi:hypothetical protein